MSTITTPHTLADLKTLQQWVCYHKDKVPFNPKTGKGADCNDSQTWGTYEEARRAWSSRRDRYAGVGFEFVKEQAITGIDLDKCIDDQGYISTYAQEIVTRLHSYTEYSPSRTGLHIWVRGSLPENIGPDVKADGDTRIEMYDCQRYFTITGDHLRGTPRTFEERQEELLAIHQETVTRRRRAKAQQEQPSSQQTSIPLFGGDTPYGRRALEHECALLASTPEGSRNDQLNRSAYSLGQLIAGNELTRATAVRELYAAARNAGLTYREIERTMNSGLEAGMREPRSAPSIALQSSGGDGRNRTDPPYAGVPEPDGEFVLHCLRQDEWGDSLLFAHLFQGQVLYDHTEKTWYLWNRHHWIEDITDRVKHFVSGRLASVYIRAAAALNEQVKGTDDNDEQAKERIIALKKMIKALTERALHLRTVARNKNVLTFAAAHEGMGITSEKWDRNPWVLAVPNGVLDLQTGTLRAGQPQDYIRTVCPTEWRGLDAPCDRFEQFLQEIFADRHEEERTELIGFLRRLLGYGITGEVLEHIFALFYGEDGRNGKDTLQRAISNALGQVSSAISKDVLLDTGRLRSAGSATPHLCDLQGKRLAWASEPEKGARFNVGLIKELSGGGDIPVRGLYERKMTKIKPSHLLILLTNHKPHADANDSAFWDRLRLVTFNMRFVDSPMEENERKKDTTLWSKLEQEAPGILAWLVRGCLEWQREGLATPKSVLHDGARYREEEDIIRQFIEESCVMAPNAEFRAKALYERYKAWCEASHIHYMNSTNFGRQFGKKKFEKCEDSRGIYYKGIGPRCDDPLLASQQAVGSSSCGMESSEQLSMPSHAAPQANVQPLQQASSGQYGGFLQKVADSPPETAKMTELSVKTLHTVHSSSQEYTMSGPVERLYEGMESSGGMKQTLHSSVSVPSREYQRALYQALRSMLPQLAPHGSLLWNVPGSGFEIGMVSQADYLRRLLMCCKSGDTGRIQAAVAEMKKRLGKNEEASA